MHNLHSCLVENAVKSGEKCPSLDEVACVHSVADDSVVNGQDVLP